MLKNISDNISIRDYRNRFYKIITLNKSDLNIHELRDWCRDNLGKQYLDWNIIDRGRQDKDLELWIREEERYLMYRLRWGNEHETYNLDAVHKF
jgi:hypothetical protein